MATTQQSLQQQQQQQQQSTKLDRYVVIHVATTCDEHGVYVTKDSAEVIEIGWILLDANKCEEVSKCRKPDFLLPGKSILIGFLLDCS